MQSSLFQVRTPLLNLRDLVHEYQLLTSSAMEKIAREFHISSLEEAGLHTEWFGPEGLTSMSLFSSHPAGPP